MNYGSAYLNGYGRLHVLEKHTQQKAEGTVPDTTALIVSAGLDSERKQRHLSTLHLSHSISLTSSCSLLLYAFHSSLYVSQKELGSVLHHGCYADLWVALLEVIELSSPW